MKVSLYIGGRGGMFGGAENTILTLAEALALSHSVELVTHDPAMTVDTFAKGSAMAARIGIRHVPEQSLMSERIFPGRRSVVKAWHAEVSRGADFFLNFANRTPPFCNARCGIQRVFFPFQIPPHMRSSRGMRAWIRAAYHRMEWQAKWKTYDALVANSEYTAGWVRRRWGLDCQVIYPPVDTAFRETKKECCIASVGRFTLWGNAKKQLELMETFRSATAIRSAGWRYFTIGGRGPRVEDMEYLEKVHAAAPNEAVVLADAPREEMKQILERASIFWHAAGWGEDPETCPGAYEHFGQSTVEAMAAGCVPVVIHGGGQPEIVEHGVSGFLWKTGEELLEFTRLLTENEALRKSMSDAARRRAALFGKEVFLKQFCGLINRVAAKKGLS